MPPGEKPATPDQRVGKNVQKFRIAAGKTQAELAATISTATSQIPQQTILKIEQGTRPLKYLEAVRVCAALKIDLQDLMVDDISIDADFMECITTLRQCDTEIESLAATIGEALTRLTTVTQQPSFGDDTERVEHAQAWLAHNWGRELNLRLDDHIDHARPIDSAGEELTRTYSGGGLAWGAFDGCDA